MCVWWIFRWQRQGENDKAVQDYKTVILKRSLFSGASTVNCSKDVTGLFTTVRWKEVFGYRDDVPDNPSQSPHYTVMQIQAKLLEVFTASETASVPSQSFSSISFDHQCDSPPEDTCGAPWLLSPLLVLPSRRHPITNESPSDFSPAGFAFVGGIENFPRPEANGVHLALTGWYFHSRLALTNCVIWSHLFTVPFLRGLFCLCRAVSGGEKRAAVGYD